MRTQESQTIVGNESLNIVSVEIYITNYHAEDFPDIEEGYCEATLILWVDFEDQECLFPIEVPVHQQFETERIGSAAAAIIASTLLPDGFDNIATEVNVYDALNGKLLFAIDIEAEFGDE